MSADTVPFDLVNPPPDVPRARYEMSLIETHLARKGYHLKDLHALPNEIAKALMREASFLVSMKLAEIETRSRLVNHLHGDF